MSQQSPVAARIPPQASYGRLRRQVAMAAVMFALALIAVQAFQIWYGYRAARNEAQQRAANLVYILSAHMQEAMAALDASLVQIAAAGARLGGPAGDASDWNAVLTGAMAGIRNAGSLTVTDAQGVIRHSTVAQIIGQSRRDLYVFQTLSRDAKAGLVADQPFKSKTSREMLIPLGRPLLGADGSFQGIAVVTLRLQQLRDFYRSIDVGTGGLIRILHPNGTVLFREPSTLNPIGEPALDDPVYQAYRNKLGDGLLEEATGPNGRPLITAFQALAAPGMLLAVSLDRDTALAAWRRDLTVNGGLLAAELLALLLATAAILQLLQSRQAATLRLASRERQMQLALAIANMGATTFDLAAGTARLSPQIAPIFGWPDPVEEIALPHFLAAVNAADRPRVERAIADCARLGGVYREEFRITRPDGTERIVWSEGFQDADSAPNVIAPAFIASTVIGMCQDVTDRRLAERQLAQALKMEGVGQLTGGVAHDFNNLLTIIIGNLEALTESKDAKVREMAEPALRAADRGADLVRSLLAFSRKQPLQPRAVQLNGIVQETDQLLRRTLGEQVDLVTMLEPKIWPTLVDPAQLQAALVNLAVNARDAMPEGGKLTLETANVVLDGDYAQRNPEAKPGPYVLLAVSDTGGGIPAGILERVFEPFFTTKEVGKGTGLGLSMVYGLIKQSNGHIKIYSEVGHGTTVKLYLPSSEPETATAAAPAVSALGPVGNETVLVVEDDAMVRKFVVQLLRQLGYQTPQAGTGAEALVVLGKTAQVDLLLTDVILPGGMTGKQLAEEALRQRPGLKVLYMSGYTENAIVHHGRLDPGIHLLSKPFRAADLATMVRRALTGTESSKV